MKNTLLVIVALLVGGCGNGNELEQLERKNRELKAKIENERLRIELESLESASKPIKELTLREKVARTACHSNQRTIRTTIQQWATDKRKGDSDSPSEDDIKGYFEGEKLPLCPAGGTYDLATVGDYPSCNKHGCYIDEEETE